LILSIFSTTATATAYISSYIKIQPHLVINFFLSVLLRTGQA